MKGTPSGVTTSTQAFLSHVRHGVLSPRLVGNVAFAEVMFEAANEIGGGRPVGMIYSMIARDEEHSAEMMVR